MKNVKTWHEDVLTPSYRKRSANLKEGKIPIQILDRTVDLLGKKVGDIAEIKIPQGIINLGVPEHFIRITELL